MLPLGCSGHFPPLQWTRQTFAVVGIFPFVPMGMLRFDGSGHFPFICNGHVGHSLFWASFLFIQTGMLRFGCSGHPFLSFKRACCVLAVLGIFSLHEVGHVAFGHFGAFFLSCKWACRILVVLAMLSFHWSETLGGGSVSNSSGAPWVLIFHDAFGALKSQNHNPKNLFGLILNLKRLF